MIYSPIRMDIEQLSKSQVVLLTLLVTFVTSIATGIVTVSLMEKAPPAIAQTVNRVVEHTIERIVPTTQTASAGQTKTMLIKESDLMTQSVADFSPSVVRLYSSDSTDPLFLGLGVVVESGGVISDTAALGAYGDAVAVFGDGSRLRLFVVARDDSNGYAFLRVSTSTIETGAKPIAWVPATIAPARAKLAESVVALNGKTIPRVNGGMVTSIVPRQGSGDIVETDLPEGAIMYGSPLINDNGDLVGMSTEISRAVSGNAFVAVSVPKGSGSIKK